MTPDNDNSDLTVPPLAMRTLGEPRFHTSADIAAVAALSNGTIVAIDEAGMLRQWTAEGELLRRDFLSDLETLWCFSASGSLLAGASDDYLIWSTKTGELLARVEHTSWVTALAFSPNEKTLATGHDDGTIRFWETVGFTLVAEMPAFKAGISALKFAPDGVHLAAAGEDRMIQVWNTTTKKKLADWKSHTDRIPELAWSADGQYLTSAGWDTSARVWKLGESDPVILLNSHADQVLCASYHPTLPQRLITADSDNDIYIWSDATIGKVGQILRGHLDEIRSISFSPDGKKVISAGADRVVHIWDAETGQLLAGLNPKGKHATVVFQHDDKMLLASTGGPFFRVWDVATGLEMPMPGERIAAYSVTVTPDSRWLAVGGTDHFTRLFDLSQPTLAPRLLEATKPPIGSIAIHPKGDLVAHTSPADGLVWLWTTNTAEPLLILIEAADGCTLEGVAFHPDGDRVIVGGIDYLSTGERDGAVCIWDLKTQQKLATFDNGVYAVAVDPSGRYVAGAGINDHVYLWDLTKPDDENEPALTFELEGHNDKVHCVAFSPDGSYVLSASDDLTLKVWDVLSGRLISETETDSAVQSMVFSQDGQYLFTGNANTTCHQIEFAKLIED
ncbi:MAG: hypothetical protein ACRC8S_03670 [Fimbriiglobus sp.]